MLNLKERNNSLPNIQPGNLFIEPPLTLFSTNFQFEGYTKDNMVHVDGFLYTEDDVDELCDSGKLSRNYCLKCGSKETRPLNFISHSASVVQLQFLFQVLLKDKIQNKVVLDVGSRLGAVLYAVSDFAWGFQNKWDNMTMVWIKITPSHNDTSHIGLPLH